MNSFIANLDKTLTDEDGNVIISLTVSGADRYTARQCVNEVKKWVLGGKNGVSVTIEKPKRKRSLDANAYFHVLVDKIAKVLRVGREEVKARIVCDYGAVEVEGVGLPKCVEVGGVFKYCSWLYDCNIDGKMYSFYQVFKHTHTYDTTEMQRLIEGAVYEAKQLGIETATPDEINKMVGIWKATK